MELALWLTFVILLQYFFDTNNIEKTLDNKNYFV